MITFKPIVKGSEIAGRQPKVEVEDETRPILLMALLFASGASPEIVFLDSLLVMGAERRNESGGPVPSSKHWSRSVSAS